MVGTPDISDVHFHAGEPLRFKADFEVLPEIELGEYNGIEVAYDDPQVTDEDVDKRIEELRDQKADYVERGAPSLADGDFALVALESVAGVEGEPIRNEEMKVQIGGADTFQAFTDNLRGLAPGEEKEFEVTYPEDYGQPRLAGKTVRFRAWVKGLRRKELPEVNDEFAQDLGDYRTWRSCGRPSASPSRPAGARGPAGGQEEAGRQAGGCAPVSDAGERWWSARSATGWKAPGATWPGRASTPARSSSTGRR